MALLSCQLLAVLGYRFGSLEGSRNNDEENETCSLLASVKNKASVTSQDDSD